MKIIERLAGLRALMKKNQLVAFLITGADPHLSEYPPEAWKSREWISGFTGSYGKVLVTMDRAFLWTDTRYFLQAAEELKGTGIELMKERVTGAISVDDWLEANLKPGDKVGVDGLTVSAAEVGQTVSRLAAKGIHFDTKEGLVDQLWEDRPAVGVGEIYDYPVSFAGSSRIEKMEIVRKILASKNLDSAVVTMLDEVAWLFNLRGDEIQFTPLFTAYAYLDLKGAWLFVHPGRISEELLFQLNKDGIEVSSYGSFFQFLERIVNKRIQIDPVRTNSLVERYLSGRNSIDRSMALATQLKSIKGPEVIINIRSAHRKDGAAVVQTLYWLHRAIKNEKISEISIGRKLSEFRSKQLYFKGDSFHPIVGFGSHGAIVHYHATAQSDCVVEPDNLLLIDSGGQYLDGTTDLTRTIGLGSVSQKQKADFTCCLKSHIALATAIFPEGTKGYSLDSIARKSLWDNGINYGHGTGHGIGYFLSVHEGPMSIRSEFNNEPIREGQLLSNEPGVYREEEYGIRIENVIYCKKYASTEFGNFLCFETVSLCPIDRQLIKKELLNQDEIDWINHYHETVRREISPLIADKNVLEWLKTQCAPLDVSE